MALRERLILSLTVSFISVLNGCITSAISCLNCCWNVTKSAAMTMPVDDSAAGTAAAAVVLYLAHP